MQKDLKEKVAGATKWSSVTEIGAKLVAPLTNAILARLLSPEIFGVVATLTLVVSFAEIFTDAGFQKYIIQHEFRDDEDLDLSTNVAFWANLAFSFLLWGVIAVFATPIAELVGSSGYETAIVVMSAEIPLLAFSSIQMARYRRDFDFKNLFVARMAVAAVPLVVTVPAALFFRSHWALVIGTLARDVLNAVILTVRSKWKPRFRFAFVKLKEMFSFSFWTMVENVTIWLTSNVDVFIVSSVLSAYYLGLYKTTMSTVNSYMGIITAATTPVLFSALSRCQNDDGAFKEVFFRFQRWVAILIFPLGFGAFAFRELATQVLLGDQWMETADFLGFWFLTSALTVVFNNYNSEAFRSKGKPKLSIFVQVLHMAALIPLLLWGVNQTYHVLTISRAFVRLELVLASAIVMQVSIGIRYISVIRNVWPSLLSAVLMACVGSALLLISDHILWQLVSICVCMIFYVGIMLIIPAGRQQLNEVPIIRKLLECKK